MIITRERLAEIIDQELAQFLSESPKKKGETNAQFRARLDRERRNKKRRSGKQQVSRKETPASTLKAITDALNQLGYKVSSRESSPGVTKAWLQGPWDGESSDGDQIASVLNSAGIPCKAERSYGDKFMVRGPGFEMEVQDEDDIDADNNARRFRPQLYVGVYRGGPRGEEERMGIDTTDLGESDLHEGKANRSEEQFTDELMAAAEGIDGVENVRGYPSLGMMTRDSGFVATMQGGSKFQVTIVQSAADSDEDDDEEDDGSWAYAAKVNK